MSGRREESKDQKIFHGDAQGHYAVSAFTPEELSIRRMESLSTDRAVLTRKTHFEGGDVLVCHAGKFRFHFDDMPEAIDLLPGETLVIYPGNIVTIEALQRGSQLKYVIFNGTRVAEFFDGFGFYDRLHFSGNTQQELFDLAVRISADDVSRALSHIHDALAAFSHALRSGKNAGRHAMLGAIHRNVRAGLPRLKTVCDELGIDRATLYRRFGAYGLGNPGDYVNNLQYRRARQLLQSTTMPISDIARAVGISSPIYFSEFIRRHSGTTPTKLREEGLLG